MLTHGNLLHNVESCRQVLAAVDHDRFVVLLPMFHSFMLCVCIFLPLTVGGSMVLVKSLHPPKNIVTDIIRRQATILPAIPPLFRALTNAPDSRHLAEALEEILQFRFDVEWIDDKACLTYYSMKDLVGIVILEARE